MITPSDIFATRFGLGRVIAAGWNLFRIHFMSILRIFVLVYIPINIALAAVPVDALIEEHGMRGFRLYMRLIQLTEFFFGVIATMALARLVEASLVGQPISWGKALRHALSRWGSSIGTGLLGGLIILGMLLLLIVPGIIWSLYYSLVVYVVALRGFSGKRALDYSKSIVKGQWWRVFGYLCAIEIMTLLAGFLVSIPNFFLPDHRIFDIAFNTVGDIVSALFLCMTIVFFINNDYMRLKRSPAAAPITSAPPPLPGM